MRTGPTIVAAALVAASACSPADDEVPTGEDVRQAHADTVMLAEEMYDPAVFDTIAWESHEAALERGAVVFSFSCQKCHGPEGAGDGGFVNRGVLVVPPSLLADDWQFAEDREGLHKKVFSGTAAGMPHWGFYGLKFRDIDAVAIYIQESLRQP